MKALRLTLHHTYCLLLELFRQPTYVLPTVLFPGMFYLFFAAPNAKDAASSNLLLASFAAFSVLGVVMVQFGVGIAEERESHWYHYLHTLPVSARQLFTARVLAALVFGLLAAATTAAVCSWASPVDLSYKDTLRLLVGLVSGAIPFCLLGILIGLNFRARAALPAVNMLYLPLSFAGGLWIPPNALPDSVQKVSEYLPTRHYGELVWAAALGKDWQSENWFWMAGYFVIFLVLVKVSRLKRSI